VLVTSREKLIGLPLVLAAADSGTNGPEAYDQDAPELKAACEQALSSRHDPLSLRLPRSDVWNRPHGRSADRYKHQGSRRAARNGLSCRCLLASSVASSATGPLR